MRTSANHSVTVRRRFASAPSWTDPNAHDPGVVIIGLFAFLTTGLLYRTARTPRGRARVWAGVLAAGLGAAAGTVALRRGTR